MTEPWAIRGRPLTIFGLDVFDGVIFEQVFVLVRVAHERVEDFLNDDQHMGLQEVPRVQRVDSGDKKCSKMSIPGSAFVAV